MSSDKDLISKEEHELNYVLKKWDKKQSAANREKLASALDAFHADASRKPHNRENFYKYADDQHLKKSLE